MQKNYIRKGKRDVNDAIALRVPDRVPIMVTWGFLPAYLAGKTVQEVMYDPDKLWDVQWKVTEEFKPDMERNPYALSFLGPVLESLDFKQLRWAGHGLGPNATYQFVEGEYMKVDEYDWFFDDPSDFIFRRYLPRICGKLKGLEKLPPLRNFITYTIGIPFDLIPFASPEASEALSALQEAGKEALRIASYSRRFAERAKEEGFPLQTGSFYPGPLRYARRLLPRNKGAHARYVPKAG